MQDESDKEQAHRFAQAKLTDLSEIPCRVSNIARGGGNTVPFNRLKSVEPTRRFLQGRHGQYRG